MVLMPQLYGVSRQAQPLKVPFATWHKVSSATSLSQVRNALLGTAMEPLYAGVNRFLMLLLGELHAALARLTMAASCC